MSRSRVPYALKAAALAAGTLLATPYLAIYDMMVLAISRRLPGPHRVKDRLSRLRTSGTGRHARSHRLLLHGHADGARRHADCLNPHPGSCRFVVAA